MIEISLEAMKGLLITIRCLAAWHINIELGCDLCVCVARKQQHYAMMRPALYSKVLHVCTGNAHKLLNS